MWVFLVTEIMFFGGMFATYLIYRLSYYNAWVAGSRTMEIQYGTANTAVLICSSLTMVMAVHFAKLGNRKLTALFLVLTLILGLGFLGIKGVEYHGHWVHHEVPRPELPLRAPGQLRSAPGLRSFSRCTLP